MAETFYRSETSYYREEVLPYCGGIGLDIGYGGDPIKPSAITIDLALDRFYCGPHPCHIAADARSLPWFASRSMDYVYSSHCLEDFPETRSVLREWLRVIKDRGLLVLLLPDLRKYEKQCLAEGLPMNPAHKIADFGPDYLRRMLRKVGGARIILLKEGLGDYNFLCIVEKVGWDWRVRDMFRKIRGRLNVWSRLKPQLKKIPWLYRLKKAVYPGKPPANGSGPE